MAVGAAAFAGAQVSRLTSDWIFAPITSADQEIRSDLTTLRARSRELVRNNSYASRFMHLLAENVVGSRGIRLQARVVNPLTGEQDEKVNQKIERAWKEWSKPANASVDGRLSWVDIQSLAVQTVAQDGECLIRMVEGYDNPFGFALQILDADQLDVSYSEPAGRDQNEVRMGVEVNEWGRPVAYHLFRGHPYDYQTRRGHDSRERVPANQIAHLYLTRRPGQSRGVPWFAPVLMDVRMLGGLQEAELVASRMSAAKAGWFVADESTVPDPKLVRGQKRKAKMRVEPGLFDFLPTGAKDFKPWDPQHPNTAFESFNTVILRSIATGLRSSYAALSGDLTKVSYSSIRQGTLQDRDVWRSLQWWLATHLHERVRDRWMVWALTTRQLELDSMRMADWDAHEWMPRGWEWVDPLKEVVALEKAFELLIDSRTRAAGERGMDYPEVVADRAREIKLAEAVGVPDGTSDTSALALSLLTTDEGDDEGDEDTEAKWGGRISTALKPRENGNGRY